MKVAKNRTRRAAVLIALAAVVLLCAGVLVVRLLGTSSADVPQIPNLRGVAYGDHDGGIPDGPSIVMVDVSVNVLGEPASGALMTDDGAFTVVAECNAGKLATEVHTVALGVIPSSDVTAEIRRRAREGAFDRYLGCYHYPARR